MARMRRGLLRLQVHLAAASIGARRGMQHDSPPPDARSYAIFFCGERAVGIKREDVERTASAAQSAAPVQRAPDSVAGLGATLGRYRLEVSSVPVRWVWCTRRSIRSRAPGRTQGAAPRAGHACGPGTIAARGPCHGAARPPQRGRRVRGRHRNGPRLCCDGADPPHVDRIRSGFDLAALTALRRGLAMR
jgi:hypothetical protein